MFGRLSAGPGFVGTVVVYSGDRELGRTTVETPVGAQSWWVDLASDTPPGEGRVVLLSQSGVVLGEDAVPLHHTPPPYCG
jgi:hypothetical protein